MFIYVYIILYHIILYHIVLYCIILYYIILHLLYYTIYMFYYLMYNQYTYINTAWDSALAAMLNSAVLIGRAEQRLLEPCLGSNPNWWLIPLRTCLVD